MSANESIIPNLVQTFNEKSLFLVGFNEVLAIKNQPVVFLFGQCGAYLFMAFMTSNVTKQTIFNILRLDLNAFCFLFPPLLLSKSILINVSER